MATDHELVLYVMTGCPYCIKVKRFLADNGVTIPERNNEYDSRGLCETWTNFGKR